MPREPTRQDASENHPTPRPRRSWRRSLSSWCFRRPVRPCLGRGRTPWYDRIGVRGRVVRSAAPRTGKAGRAARSRWRAAYPRSTEVMSPTRQRIREVSFGLALLSTVKTRPYKTDPLEEDGFSIVPPDSRYKCLVRIRLPHATSKGEPGQVSLGTPFPHMTERRASHPAAMSNVARVTGTPARACSRHPM